MQSRFGHRQTVQALTDAVNNLRRRLLEGGFPPHRGVNPESEVGAESGMGAATAMGSKTGMKPEGGINAGAGLDPEPDMNPEALAEAVFRSLLRLQQPGPRRVINATGVVLHTNLGRAVLSPAVMEHVAEAATGFTDLEFDLASGGRGSRHHHTERLLQHLTGAPAAMAVNNNAAAVLLALAALAAGKNVIVSRGELVEIGGSFRIPEVMAAGGARLVEVGTTNRTRIADYDAAIDEETALLLKVHTSNYRIVGFTEDVSVEELAVLGRRRNIPVMYDMGSGSLADWTRRADQHDVGLGAKAGGADRSFLTPTAAMASEPTVQAALEAGADLVTFSGDKLLGGPQAGILAGHSRLIDACRRHPLARAVRLDKMVIAALAATLAEYLDPDGVYRRVPTLAMLSASREELAERAQRLAASLQDRFVYRGGSGGSGAVPDPHPHQAVDVSVVSGASKVGGGSMPGAALPTALVALQHRDDPSEVYRWENRLRLGTPPVAARVADGRLLLDLRTVLFEQEEALVSAVVEALSHDG